MEVASGSTNCCSQQMLCYNVERKYKGNVGMVWAWEGVFRAETRAATAEATLLGLYKREFPWNSHGRKSKRPLRKRRSQQQRKHRLYHRAQDGSPFVSMTQDRNLPVMILKKKNSIYCSSMDLLHLTNNSHILQQKLQNEWQGETNKEKVTWILCLLY
jgi:hypothetical protein